MRPQGWRWPGRRRGPLLDVGGGTGAYPAAFPKPEFRADVHDDAVRAWLRDAGLDEPRRIALETSHESLVLAGRKP